MLALSFGVGFLHGILPHTVFTSPAQIDSEREQHCYEWQCQQAQNSWAQIIEGTHKLIETDGFVAEDYTQPGDEDHEKDSQYYVFAHEYIL